MKFQKNTRRRAKEYEKDLVQYWKDNKTFEKSVENRPQDNAYVFYDGPPFITGVPHHGTLLTSVVKDAIPRYWTMKGKRVERRWGWDCHGLPAEVFTEKKLGIKDKRDIGTKISLEDYITTCRTNMVQTGNEWEDVIDRIGRWVDFAGAYKTMDKEFMESVWWAFKELHEKGKIYEGERVLMYCTRDATPIAKAEVAMDNSYQDVTDPSVYVKFKLTGENKYLLAWTTMAWTLPANSALAINENEEYVEAKLASGENLILAKSLVEKALTDEKHKAVDFEIIREFSGKELVGKTYEPLFEPEEELKHDKAFNIWHADFVHLDEGTGVVHLSPGTGEEDYDLSKEKGFPWVMSTDESGIFVLGEWKGENLWEANKPIAKELLSKGVVWKIDYIVHNYPHCHRCGTKLIYRAHPSWFMDIDGQRKDMLEQNEAINWFPKHIKNGRSQKTIESAPDWNLSRDRFWATPMPVWKGVDSAGNEHIKIVGSYKELEELSGKTLDDYHRPWVDDITFEIDDVEYRRIEKVMDCWFESGSMPFAQHHYPFENKDKFENSFPADFIVEYVPQVRAWFYYMEAVNVGLFGKAAFQNAIVHGTIAGSDGRKMSKSFGNYTDPNELMDTYSADSLRFVLLSSPLLNGEDFSLVDKDVADVARKLSMIWNMYDFFTLYADVDGWEWDGSLEDPSNELTNPLDLWIVSRVHQTNKQVDLYMEKYDIPNAMKPLLEFLDDASNWYVRRSRKRFWKSENDSDKNEAYRTLHYILVQVSMIFAPFTPFLAEELFRKLTGGESVHLLDWPVAGDIDEALVEQMNKARDYITEGLSIRAKESIKVRQPLACATLPKLPDAYKDVIKEELNVKQVIWHDSDDTKVILDLTLSEELKAEGIMREVIRQVQNFRKASDLEVDDHIELSLSSTEQTISKAIEHHSAEIKAETLANSLNSEGAYEHATAKKISGFDLSISLQKA
ncbi:isoleucine--tRNA ligase [Candidatus Saccharibacteria bacterium]|jgi:isoleucyl-tRNA synthetase|nr:isoleucine--tRNA ligase [Candidatus Saccharibacteria bacterium]MBP9131715.1 isoleucine--tRNA ligase [Candidatus Saccharibacteria bacterium]